VVGNGNSAETGLGHTLRAAAKESKDGGEGAAEPQSESTIKGPPARVLAQGEATVLGIPQLWG